MTSAAPSAEDRLAFYRAAVLGLRALDARERAPRRFGPDADARWAQFAGALGLGDRIDILLRDAAATWGSAFSPSDCFGLFGLAEDEPFGPDWGGIDDRVASRLLSETSGSATLDDVAAAIGLKVTPVAFPVLTPSTKLVVAGGSALVAVARSFAENGGLSWSDQVVAIGSLGSFRQLAGLAAVLLGARGRTVIIRPGADAEGSLRAAGFGHLDTAVVSPDAEPEAAELARTVGGK